VRATIRAMACLSFSLCAWKMAPAGQGGGVCLPEPEQEPKLQRLSLPNKRRMLYLFVSQMTHQE
jgi:hypothetical protein